MHNFKLLRNQKTKSEFDGSAKPPSEDSVM